MGGTVSSCSLGSTILRPRAASWRPRDLSTHAVLIECRRSGGGNGPGPWRASPPRTDETRKIVRSSITDAGNLAARGLYFGAGVHAVSVALCNLFGGVSELC